MAEQISPQSNLIACKKTWPQARLRPADRKRNVLMREMMRSLMWRFGMQKEIATRSSARAAERQHHAGHRPVFDSVVPEERGFSMHGHSIMGVDLPTGEVHSSALSYYGFRNSNSQLDAAYMAFDHVKRLCAS
ncbi:MAG: V-type ATP synthase subunit D [Ruthenibacterium lactatiformans]